MVLVFSTAGTELYRQFVLQVLCYPNGHVLSDVSWSLNRAHEKCHDAEAIESDCAIIVFVDYYAGSNGSPVALYLPLRIAQIKRARIFAGKILLDLSLGDFVYYGPVEEARRAGTARLPEGLPKMAQHWTNAIATLGAANQDDIPHAVRKKGTPTNAVLNYDPGNWESGGRFLTKCQNEIGGIKVSTETMRQSIRLQHDDWRSVIDMLAASKPLLNTLFYQFYLEATAGKRTPKAPIPYNGGSIYQFKSGERADMRLHFYFGSGRPDPQRVLQIVTDPAYISTVGRTLIDVYPQQESGKVEELQIVAKRQISQEFTTITLQEKIPAQQGASAALATAQLDLQVVPRRLYIAGILALFFAGTLVNTLPTDIGPKEWHSWLLVGEKLFGTGLITLAFFLGFSKLPSKAD